MSTPHDRRAWDVRRLLSLPALYRAFSDLMGARRSRAEIVETYFRPETGMRVLDCGCGPGDLLDFLPTVEYVGIDIDPSYVDAARARFGARGAFRLGPLGAETMIEEGHYDLVIALGVLHHLDDDTVRSFAARARRALRPGGRLVTVDPCYVDGQSPIARKLLDLDRGDHVRPLDAWAPLVREPFPRVTTTVRHDLLRIPYTHLIMTCPADRG